MIIALVMSLFATGDLQAQQAPADPVRALTIETYLATPSGQIALYQCGAGTKERRDT
jgi:hypothetical protein